MEGIPNQWQLMGTGWKLECWRIDKRIWTKEMTKQDQSQEKYKEGDDSSLKSHPSSLWLSTSWPSYSILLTPETNSLTLSLVNNVTSPTSIPASIPSFATNPFVHTIIKQCWQLLPRTFATHLQRSKKLSLSVPSQPHHHHHHQPLLSHLRQTTCQPIPSPHS